MVEYKFRKNYHRWGLFRCRHQDPQHFQNIDKYTEGFQKLLAPTHPAITRSQSPLKCKHTSVGCAQWDGTPRRDNSNLQLGHVRGTQRPNSTFQFWQHQLLLVPEARGSSTVTFSLFLPAKALTAGDFSCLLWPRSRRRGSNNRFSGVFASLRCSGNLF